MPIGTGNWPKLLWPGVNKIFGLTYDKHPKEYPMIFETYNSTRAFEEDVLGIGFGYAEVIDEGSSISYDTAKQSFIQRYTHVEYGKGFIVTKNMYEDDQYDLPSIKGAKNLAFSLTSTKETVAANVLNRAFSDSYTFGDGKELCATDHPTGFGGTWANELTTAADLSEASLEQACKDINKMQDARTLPIAISPIRLIIHADDEFEAGRILKSELQNDTANNAINVIRATGKFPGGYHINHYLIDSDAWFIITNCPDGMKHFERKKMSFDMDNDFDTSNAKFKAQERYSFGCSNQRGIFGSPGV
ncbi:MAG: Mu-like prophage major head subunit gpT family protein [Candidatus Aenigmatarchaeota archaeon]